MKQLIGAAAAAVFVMSAAAAPLAAQPSEGRASASRPVDRDALRSWARCLIGRHARQVDDLLAMDFRREEHVRLVRRLAESTLCPVSGTLRSASVLLTGELAEQLLAQRMRSGGLAQLTAFSADRGPIDARTPSEVLAFCTVRQAPQPVWAAFATRPGSVQESGAMAALQPQLAQCLPVGESASFNAAGLRAILALGAYRLAQHNRPERRR